MFFKRTKGEGWLELIISIFTIIGFIAIFGPKFCSISTDIDGKGIVIETKKVIVEEVKKPDPPKQQKGEFKKL
jgi:hypothetical protein